MAKPRDLRVTIEVDTSKFERQIRSFRKASLALTYAQDLRRTMQKVQEAMELSKQQVGVLVYALDTFAKTPAQIEAIYYARGAMDARYETPAQRDAYLRVLLRCGPHHDVAVAGFLRGWVEHRGRHLEARPLTWHRYLAGTKIEVSVS